MKKIAKFAVLLAGILITGCSSMDGGRYPPLYTDNQDAYTEIVEQEFVNTEDVHSSYIALNTSTASYTDIRNRIINNLPIDKDAVKIEEMINFFSYNYGEPVEDEVMSLNSAIIDTPWSSESKLLMVGMQAAKVDLTSTTNNIVLLIDVSGSMYGTNRLDLVKASFMMLVDNLKYEDTISIVTYSGSNKVVLDGAKGTEKNKIKSVIADLSASGSTAGSSAIEKAYSTALKYHGEGINSTIILATDGDFNVGVSDPDELRALISEYNLQGVSLSAIGVGFGNLKNNTLESIAEAGNGRHLYLSDLDMAKKFFADDIGGLLNVVARDGKAQIQFNPNEIEKFRIIGYENRTITEEEFEDEDTQAGAIGSGLQVTAIFEIIMAQTETSKLEEFATLTLKCKVDGQSVEDSLSIDVEHMYRTSGDRTIIDEDDVLFIASIIELGLILRDSKYKGTASYQSIYERLTTISSLEDDEYRLDFLNLIEILIGRDGL